MKLFVWDFHGVLEKDNHLAVFKITNTVLKQNGYKRRLSTQENQDLYGLRWYEYFENLLPNLDKTKCLELQSDCFKYAGNNIHIIANCIKPNKYANKVVKAINDAWHDQILLSNTRPNDLLWYIDTVGLKEYFPKSKLFGLNTHENRASKSDTLREYLKNKKYDGIVIIGDSGSDMALKSVNGGVTYLYRHPYIVQSEKIDSDYKITNLSEILKEV